MPNRSVPQSGTDHQRQHRFVAQPQQRLRLEGIEQFFCLCAREPERGAVLADGEPAQACRRIAFDHGSVERFGKELAADGHFAADGGGGGGFVLLRETGHEFAGEAGAVGVEVIAGDIRQREVPGFEDKEQFGEIAGVGEAGAGRELSGDEGIDERVASRVGSSINSCASDSR